MGYTWQYYDLVLGAILATMSVGVAVGAVTSLAMPTAITGAGAVAAVLVAHGLLVNGPVDRSADLTTTSRR